MADAPRSRTDLESQFETPRVSSPPSMWPVVIGLLGALALGAIVFLQLSANRARIEEARLTDAAPNASPLNTEGVPPPPDMTSLNAPPQVQLLPEPDPGPDPYAGEPVQLAPPLAQTAESTGRNQAELDRLRAPALIIDLGEYRAPNPPAGAPGAGIDPRALVGAIGASQTAAGGPAGVNGNETFAQRLGVGGDPLKPARASAAINLKTTVVEGAVIPAVLETALNSDLPGYVRAVVSRDVRGFDGSQILIPRGSRLIGQYRSGIALGQSRAFVIWTRLIRPDGVAVELASPATDGLGRGGLDGDVDRHFMQRFGGSILLSLLNLAVGAVTDATDTSIVIATSRATSDAASVALAKDIDVPPTVTVPQGSPVRVFVSQDLDFSAVPAIVEATVP